MAGARSISHEESDRLVAAMGRERDRLLLLAGQHLGLRISELLSLTVKQVADGVTPKGVVSVARRNLKGGRSGRKGVRGRALPVHPDLASSLAHYLSNFPGGAPRPDQFLFRSRKGANRPLSYKSAWRILRQAAESAGIDSERVSTHSMRKTFAEEVYKASGHNLRLTQAALGHSDIQTTAKYLDPDADRVAALIRGMESRIRPASERSGAPEAPAAVLAIST